MERTNSNVAAAAQLSRQHQDVVSVLSHGLKANHVLSLLQEQKDILRYTMVLPEPSYVAGVHATLGGLLEHPGVRQLTNDPGVPALTNFWRPESSDREYLGLHGIFECPDGTLNGDAVLKEGEAPVPLRFEVQWHTEATVSDRHSRRVAWWIQ